MRRPRRSSPSNASVGQHHGKPRCSSREQRGKLSKAAPRGTDGCATSTNGVASQQLICSRLRRSWRQRRTPIKSLIQKQGGGSEVPFVLILLCTRHFGRRGPRQRNVFDCLGKLKRKHCIQIITKTPSLLMCHCGIDHPGMT